MKRIISLVLAAVICLSLCGCGKSEEVVQFEELVEKIGTVTLDSEADIKAAEKAYSALTDKDKEDAAESYELLTDMREEYEELVEEAERQAALKAEQEKRLAAVETLIDAIGTVTLDSEAAIIEAEKAFAELPEEEKEMIPEAAAKLADCRKAYDTAVADFRAAQAAHAAEASAAIEAIGAVTLDSKEAINAARTLYAALTDEEKALVTNLSILEAAEEEYAVLWEAEKQRIIDEYSSKFEISEDRVQGITWYMPKNMPDYIDIRSYIIPYIGIRGDSAWICIRYNYTDSDNWIFWKKLTIVADDKRFYKTVDYFDIVRDNDTEVWEYYDEPLKINQAMNTDELIMLRLIAESSETIIRFEGDDYYYDLYVKDSDKQMILETLTLYEALIG